MKTPFASDQDNLKFTALTNADRNEFDPFSFQLEKFYHHLCIIRLLLEKGAFIQNLSLTFREFWPCFRTPSVNIVSFFFPFRLSLLFFLLSWSGKERAEYIILDEDEIHIRPTCFWQSTKISPGCWKLKKKSQLMGLFIYLLIDLLTYL